MKKLQSNKLGYYGKPITIISRKDILDTPSILGSNELAHIVRASDSLSGWIETDIVKAKAP